MIETYLFRTPTIGIVRPISHEQFGVGTFNCPTESMQKNAYDGNHMTVADSYSCITANSSICVAYRLPRTYRGCTVYFDADIFNVDGFQGSQHIQVGYRRTHQGENIPFYDNGELKVGHAWTRLIKEFTIHKPVAEIYFKLTNTGKSKTAIRPRHVHIDNRF